MTGEPTHECPGGCGRMDVAAGLIACATCTYWLPADIRQALTFGDEDAEARALDALARKRSEDEARPSGTIRYDPLTGAYYSWSGRSWRLCTWKEQEAAAWANARHGTPNPFSAAFRAAQATGDDR